MTFINRISTDKQDNASSLRISVEQNLINIISGRIPLWEESLPDYLTDTIASIGLTNTSFENGKVSDEVLRARIKDLIQRFEKRLINIQVELIQRTKTNNVELKISGLIKTELEFEMINFNSNFNLGKNELNIRKHNLV